MLLDTPPIVYHLEGHRSLSRRFAPLFERHAAGEIEFAITTIGIAGSAARLRAGLGLKLADAVQVASALAINADALVTHGRDLKRVKVLPILF